MIHVVAKNALRMGRVDRFYGRGFAAYAPSLNAVKLAYEVQEPPSSAKSDIAKHTNGLVNWRTLAKGMAKDYGVPVYTLDLRNHGVSPHASSMAYTDMAQDLAQFFEEHQLSKHALIGHSLGGKAVMALALGDLVPENTLSHLVVVDIAPAEGSISPEFMIEKANLSSRNEADKYLAKVEPNLGVRQFLLTNLTRTDDGLRFRNPLETLLEALDGIGEFPYKPRSDGQPAEKHWNGQTLFIKGKNSNYINQQNLPACRSFFPNMALKELPTGHWVQSEAPHEFLRTVREFIE